MKADPERASLKWRQAHLRKTYGISVEEFETMLKAQGGGCAICGAEQGDGGRNLAVDHDHATGAIRGLLCGACNKGVGHFEDQPDRLLGAAAYLILAEA